MPLPGIVKTFYVIEYAGAQFVVSSVLASAQTLNLEHI
jgi:hypothetical protein